MALVRAARITLHLPRTTARLRSLSVRFEEKDGCKGLRERTEVLQCSMRVTTTRRLHERQRTARALWLLKNVWASGRHRQLSQERPGRGVKEAWPRRPPSTLHVGQSCEEENLLRHQVSDVLAVMPRTLTTATRECAREKISRVCSSQRGFGADGCRGCEGSCEEGAGRAVAPAATCTYPQTVSRVEKR